MAPKKIVRLKYGPFVEFENYDKENNVVYVKLAEPSNPKKIKGVLNWVGSNAQPILLRLFDGLKMTELECLGEENLQKDIVSVESHFQFEKYGFYCVDPDSKKLNKLVFNETVGLKSSYLK